MAVVVTGRQFDAEEFGERGAVPPEYVPRLMYYLNCVSCLTTLSIPSRLTNYDRWRSLSDDEVVALFNLVTTLSPDILMELGVFLYDTENLCVGSSNRFFNITDREFAALATEQVVIAGERVRRTKVMIFTRNWLQTYYLRPLGPLLDRVHEIRERPPAPPPRSRPAITYESTPRYSRPTSSPSPTPLPAPPPRPAPPAPAHQTPHSALYRWFAPLWEAVVKGGDSIDSWLRMAFVTVAALGVLLGFAACYSYSWIPAYPFPLHFFMGISVLAVLHTPWQYLLLRHRSERSQRRSLVYGVIVVAVCGIPALGGIFLIRGQRDVYMEKLALIWTGKSSHSADERIRIRSNIEKAYSCRGWDTTAGRDAAFCSEAVNANVTAFTGAMGVIVIVLLAIQVATWFTVMIVMSCCRTNDDSASP
jgi:hypothetical protein